MLFRIGEVDGVHGKPYIGGVLPGHKPLRDLDELHRSLVAGLLVFGEPLPIGVGLLYDYLSLFQESLQRLVDIELDPLRALPLGKAEGEVLEVDKDRQRLLPLRKGMT